ncbi:CLUMA_CG010454, isoform A [Clunio marinus]|uniref:CLUMA_CG010454, isoform A n=1 Tax=Clunio marinus TaxID=568069 RepID=A0A1J1IBJ6_9DIPT|nr:CLUMA_CG010454, isoform A [Clunio marinus]
MWFWIIAVVIILALVYYWYTLKYGYFSAQGIVAADPCFPLGNTPSMFTGKRNATYDIDDLYQQFRGKAPFIGYFEMRTPTFLLIDPEAIKSVMVQNFRNFRDNGFSKFIDKDKDPLFGRNPFMLRGDEWKEKRAEITPAFTQNRIKALFPLVEEILGRFTNYIKTECNKQPTEPLEAREICAKYTTDVVSSCVFNADAESFTKEKPEIREMGKKIFDFDPLMMAAFMLYSIFPFMTKYVKVSMVKPQVSDFFTNLMIQAIEVRQKSGIQRDDYLAHLISLRNRKEISELDMAAHGVTFFIDGFETSSVALACIFYEIASNKKVQDKLRDEIKTLYDDNGKMIYEKMLEHEYLDQVFYEVLRLHPPVTMTNRECNEEIEFENIKGKKVKLRVGDSFAIPIYSIQRDPEFYPEPEKFIPERFDPEHGGVKAFKDKGVLLPFGDGPRICLGQRFALMQTKAAIVEIVKNFEMTVNEKTKLPLIMDPKAFVNVKLGGLWLNFKPYKKLSKQGFDGPKVCFPFGNAKSSILRQRNEVYDIDDVYREFSKKAEICSYFVMFSPHLLALDPKIIKQIMISEFKYFSDNNFTVDAKIDPVIALNPFWMKSSAWKMKRSQLSPSMTPIKLKVMYPLIIEGTKTLVEATKRGIRNDKNKEFDARDISSRYCCDTISSCLFGADAQSFTSDNSVYLTNGRKMLSGIRDKEVGRHIFPPKAFPQDAETFFVEITKEAIKYRMESKTNQDDFLSQLISLKVKHDLSDNEAGAYCVTLFLDAFETASLALHLALYELGKSQDVQNKLRREIEENLEGKEFLTYEKLLELPYLDQIFYEVLRLHPPLQTTSRVCNDDCELTSAKDRKIKIKKGSVVVIPIYSIQRDARYYNNPENFNPERFNIEHGGVKAFKELGVLIPFGDGPRICLGMRRSLESNMFAIIFSILLVILAILYFAISMRFKYFSRHGVIGPKPKFPYGNIKESFKGTRNVVYDIDEIYRHYKGKAPFIGMFMMFTPYFLIIDPEIVKQVLIKSFKNFRNNDFYASKKKDPLMSRNPFIARDDEWKQLRSQTAPALTVNKLKSVYPLILDGANNMINFIKQELKTEDHKAFDAREITLRYTCDVMSNCIFGSDAASFQSEKPLILELGKNMIAGIKDSIMGMLPKPLIPPSYGNDFIQIMTDAINYREKNESARDDILAHIIAIKQKKGQSDVEAAAHGWTVFMDSYDTTAIVCHMALYHLAKDKRVQDKLREEIIENIDENAVLSYGKLIELPYLDQVLYEVLRLHPPLMFTTKVCNEDTEIDAGKGHKFMMKKGSVAMISTHSIHLDPEYYADPHGFVPERFDDEHGGVKNFRDRCVLIPFGDGPRICLGMKLGSVLVKSIIAETLKNFEMTVDDATPENWKIGASEFLNLPDTKLQLNFTPFYISRSETFKWKSCVIIKMVFLYLILAVLVLAYIFLTWNFDYWSKRGVPAMKAKILLGNLPSIILRNEHITYGMDRIYDEYKGKTPFIGILQITSPRLVLLEPELVKSVMVKNFKSFHDNEFGDILSKSENPLFSKNPFLLQGEEWKDKRAEITPAFTASRLKALYPLIEDVQGRMIAYVGEQARKKQSQEARELCAKFTIDVVSSAIFGIDANSFSEDNPKIREMAKQLLAPSGIFIFKMMLAASIPFLKHVLSLRFAPVVCENFFVDLMEQALKYREENKIQREDFLEYLIQLKSKKGIQHIDMVSHTISFFTDGFDTSSVAIAHVLYELGRNKNAQDKLRDEVDKHCDADGKINFETINEMPYLDQVWNETLRMHPPATFLSRKCTEACELEFEGKKAPIELGMNVYIPVSQFHYDPEYYPEPEKFKPERFDPENGGTKAFKEKGIFLPFGDGPRICLGMKFAQAQSKVAIAGIIRNFQISVNPKTSEKPIIDPKEFLNMLMLILVVIGLLTALYSYLTWNFEYWSSRGVLSPKPKVLFSCFKEWIQRKSHATDILSRLYNDYKGRANFIGMYQMREPRLLILKPELVKEILVKKFKNFHDNEFSLILNTKDNPLFARNPFLSRDQEWKERRSEISPGFSTNRMKVLFPCIQNVCANLKATINDDFKHPFEAKDLATKFTTDTVASCIFGIEGNSFKDADSELRQMSKRLTRPPIKTFIKMFLVAIIPPLRDYLTLSFVPDDANNFFMNLIKQAVDYRIKNKINRDDYLDFLINLQNKKGLSSTDFAGHSMTFFSDGLETSSVTIAHTLYELARNVRVQENLRKEIHEFAERNDEITFEILHEMPYLDQVLNESLRLHPPFTAISKECTEATELEYMKGINVNIEKGVNVYLPLYQIQRDAEYYPKPEEFIPERFDPEIGGVKKFKEQGIFLTFGDGPRICLGMKFAVMQTKAAIVEIIKNFKITVNEKTPKKLKIDPEESLNIKKGGLWLNFKPAKIFHSISFGKFNEEDKLPLYCKEKIFAMWCEGFCGVFINILLIIFSVVGFHYFYLLWNSDYWKKRGVFCPDSKSLFGNLPGQVNGKRNIAYDTEDLYKEYKEKYPYIGIYMFREPQLLVFDPEIIKDITVKYFKYFQATEFYGKIDKESDPLFGNHPFFLTGDEWKTKRTELSPAFTNTRIKAIFPTALDVSHKMISYIKKEISKDDFDGFDAKDLSARFTISIVSNSVYNVDPKSFEGQESEILKRGLEFASPTKQFMIKNLLMQIYPFLKKYLKLSFSKEGADQFFIALMNNAIKHRQENKIQSADYLDHLMNLKNKKEISDHDLAAHGASFLVDGFDTSSSSMVSALKELAENKEVQDRLREEINNAMPNEEDFTYDNIINLPYLDQVWNESLRLNSVVAVLRRQCTEPVEIELPKDKKLFIDKGFVIGFPVHSIHRDPEYYPNPDKFDPDRFAPENGGFKSYMERGVFLTFGYGPRICPGNRFANAQSKIALAAIIKNFEVSINPKSPKEYIFHPQAIINTLLGCYIDMKEVKRN